MNISGRRRALQLSQAELGTMAGLLQSAVSRVERGMGPVGHVDRIETVLASIERQRGVRPLRDHRIEQRRRRLGLSAEELAELSGMPVATKSVFMVGMAERGLAPPEVVREIRRALIWEESKSRREREDRRRDEARIARHRALFAAVLATDAGKRLMEAMLARAFDLLVDGDGTGFDALAEFLPEAEVGNVGDRYVDECGGPALVAPAEAEAA